MALAFSVLDSGTTNSNATSYTTGSVTPGANRLELLCLTLNRNAGLPTTPTVTGNGLTWVQIGSNVTFATDVAIESAQAVFRAMGASPSTGAITVDHGGVTHEGLLWALVEVTGMDTSGTNGSGAIVQAVTKALPTTTEAALSISQTMSAFGTVDNRGFAWACHSFTEAITPRTSWTELIDLSLATSPSRDAEAQWSNAAGTDANVSCSWPSTTSRAAIIGLEIAIASSGGTTYTKAGFGKEHG